MFDHALSAQQLAVICALSSGVTMTSAAEQAGIHRNTITNWRRNLPPFQQALAHAQYDRAIYFREKVENLVDLAIQCLQDILTDPKAPPSIKLKAALAIITTATNPPAPKKQIELNIETILVDPAPPMHNDAQPEPPPSVHNDAQSAPTDPAPPNPPNTAQPAPKICDNARPFAANSPHKSAQPKAGRNHPCPCGSGQKFKRCCLDKPLVSKEFVQRLASHPGKTSHTVQTSQASISE